jgi:hypothetical protein
MGMTTAELIEAAHEARTQMESDFHSEKMRRVLMAQQASKLAHEVGTAETHAQAAHANELAAEYHGGKEKAKFKSAADKHHKQHADLVSKGVGAGEQHRWAWSPSMYSPIRSL